MSKAPFGRGRIVLRLVAPSGGRGAGMAGNLRRLEVVSGWVEEQDHALDRGVEINMYGPSFLLFGEGVERRPVFVPGAAATNVADGPGARGIAGIEAVVPGNPAETHSEAAGIDLRVLDGSANDAACVAEGPSFVVPDLQISADELGQSFFGQTHGLSSLCGISSVAPPITNFINN